MRANRLLAATVLSVLGAAGLTACGSGGAEKGDAAPAASASSAATKPAAGGGLESLSAEQILDRMRAANAKITSVKVVFRVEDSDGDMAGEAFGDAAGNCSSSVAMEDVGKAEVLRLEGKTWVKPDVEAVRAAYGAKAVTLVAGKWVTAAKLSGLAEFTGFCDMALDLTKKAGFNEDGTPDNTVTKAGTKKVGGVDAVILTAEDEDTGDPLEIAIANEGEPYLLSLVTDGRGNLQFSHFNEPVRATAPAADQTIDLDALGMAPS
ncbi:hypothetical protein [Kitasatospora cineracea]|uniref:hypothetical protein n=1 Tax=Kitasatospora cineracea TaxID=88074 RepID=UPI0037B252A0